MLANNNQPLLHAINGTTSSRYPVWFLRQAGRYLPEYRELKKKHSFLDLCHDPKKAAEITLQPLRRFDLDAAIIFSDILTPLIAAGQHLSFKQNHGPVITPTISSKKDLLALNLDNISQKLSYVGEALSIVKKELPSEKTLIGFAGSAFTVASYMIQGQSDKTFSEVKKMAFNDPSLLTEILYFINKLTKEYLSMQVSAGADVIMLFDSWAGCLPPHYYQKLIVPPLSSLLKELKKLKVPIIYYPGNNPELLKELDISSIDVVAVDWHSSFSHAITELKEKKKNITIQGNLDPLLLHANEETVRKNVRAILQTAQENIPNRHIFNVGHGLLPSTPIESIHWAIDEIRNFQ
jgi:uroporphyrinogen decarboxylase